ncbi:hypothetical protein BGZ63DRAFT_394172 [Mariannaea sp. PMI_226]|nr:hypothetical protein BGZ63DRAFT_394172 [Mariannaea sp. PMI_226]
MDRVDDVQYSPYRSIRQLVPEMTVTLEQSLRRVASRIREGNLRASGRPLCEFDVTLKRLPCCHFLLQKRTMFMRLLGKAPTRRTQRAIGYTTSVERSRMQPAPILVLIANRLASAIYMSIEMFRYQKTVACPKVCLLTLLNRLPPSRVIHVWPNRDG